MGLLAYWKARRHRKRVEASLTILLGHYWFARLDEGVRARIDIEMERNLLASSVDPNSIWTRPSSWDVFAGERALAMARLHIEPTAYGLSWNKLVGKATGWNQLSEQLSFWPDKGPDLDARLGAVWRHFEDPSPAMEDAKAFLRERGLAIPDEDLWGPGRYQGALSEEFLEKSGLKKAWARKK